MWLLAGALAAEPGLFLDGKRSDAVPHLFSVSNDNQAFMLVVEGKGKGPTGGEILLADGTRLTTNGRGSGNDEWTVSMDLDAATAKHIAADLGLTQQLRAPIGTSLVASWAVSGTVVTLTLTEQGSGVGVTQGGRTRGPRNDRFDFRVVRADGTVLDRTSARGFGGMSQLHWLTKGKSLSVEADVRGWAELTSGSYRVECSYEAELYASEQRPSWPEEAEMVWEPVFTGTVDLVVPDEAR